MRGAVEVIGGGIRVALAVDGVDGNPGVGTRITVGASVGKFVGHLDVVILGVGIVPLDVHGADALGTAQVDVDPLLVVGIIFRTRPSGEEVGIVDGVSGNVIPALDVGRLGAQELELDVRQVFPDVRGGFSELSSSWDPLKEC